MGDLCDTIRVDWLGHWHRRDTAREDAQVVATYLSIDYVFLVKHTHNRVRKNIKRPEDKMKNVHGLFAIVLVTGLAFALASPIAAQGGTPPTLPGLDELLKMTLGAVGTFIFVALFGYYWGYAISAIAARVPFELPSWAWDALVLVPIAAVAAGWNAFAAFINATFPGVLDKTVSDVLLFLANYLMTLFFSRKGGFASVADVSRWVHSGIQTLDASAMTQRARRGVLLFG